MSVVDPSQSQRQPTRAELEEEIATRLDTLRTLGPQYTDSVAKSLLDEIDHLIDAKIKAELPQRRSGRADVAHEKRNMLIAILAFSIPLLGIAGGTAGILGILFISAALMIIAIVAMTHDF